MDIKEHQRIREEILEKAQESDLFTIESDDVIPGKRTREQAIGVLSETLHNI